jgi:hypothetical protein
MWCFKFIFFFCGLGKLMERVEKKGSNLYSKVQYIVGIGLCVLCSYLTGICSKPALLSSALWCWQTRTSERRTGRKKKPDISYLLAFFLVRWFPNGQFIPVFVIPFPLLHSTNQLVPFGSINNSWALSPYWVSVLLHELSPPSPRFSYHNLFDSVVLRVVAVPCSYHFCVIFSVP